MSELEDLKKRVELLEDVVLKQLDVNTKRLGNEHEELAAFDALHSLVVELTEHAGIAEVEFHRHFDTRYRYFLDWRLRTTEDISQSGAAEIDRRAINEVETEDSFPPLFGPEQSSQ